MKTISLLITFSLLYILCDEDCDGAEVDDYVPDSVDILRLLKWRYDDRPRIPRPMILINWTKQFQFSSTRIRRTPCYFFRWKTRYLDDNHTMIGFKNLGFEIWVLKFGFWNFTLFTSVGQERSGCHNRLTFKTSWICLHYNNRLI